MPAKLIGTRHPLPRIGLSPPRHKKSVQLVVALIGPPCAYPVRKNVYMPNRGMACFFNKIRTCISNRTRSCRNDRTPGCINNRTRSGAGIRSRAMTGSFGKINRNVSRRLSALRDGNISGMRDANYLVVKYRINVGDVVVSCKNGPICTVTSGDIVQGITCSSEVWTITSRAAVKIIRLHFLQTRSYGCSCQQ